MATRTAAPERPSPDALLEAADREGRGKLKIFLGAAPGVGKTYEMLTQGRRRRLEGIDVVIGVVETHGRLETDALTKGFEIIPKKRSLYKGHVVAEMDLDAILPWCWWTSWLTPTRREAATPNAISMSRKSWRRASTSIPR
jgi:two-component system, OmpR family, sensor histidine kinase KdpD